MYKKKSPDKFLVGLKIWTSWGVAPTIFKITLLRRHFQKCVQKLTFEKKYKGFTFKTEPTKKIKTENWSTLV